MITEIACANSESVQNAFDAGATRIELCSALSVGGLTPSIGFLHSATALFPEGVYVLIRPREGNFVYADEEFNVMLNDIIAAKKYGASGIVSGILTSSNKIDLERTAQLIAAAAPLPFTFHRAFDLLADPISGMVSLIQLGVQRILTSGQANSAFEGKELIKKLISLSEGRISIMAGAGIDPHNVRELVRYTGVNEIHFSAKRRNAEKSTVSLGATDDGSYEVSDLRTIKLIISEIEKLTD